MKKILLVSAALMLAHVAFPQGQVNFDNRFNASGTPGAFPGVVVAPFYNQDPSKPTENKQGNTSAGIPAGSTVYAGPLLFNDATHIYTAQLWALNTAQVSGTDANNNLQLAGTTTMRSNTSGTSAGRVASGAPAVVNSVIDANGRATFQVRVWDSRGGTITTWDQVLLPQNNDVARGYSTLFASPYELGGFGSPPSSAPNLEGLQSFQLFVVPEPSVIALGVLGAGCLFLLRRRK